MENLDAPLAMIQRYCTNVEAKGKGLHELWDTSGRDPSLLSFFQADQQLSGKIKIGRLLDVELLQMNNSKVFRSRYIDLK